MYKLTLNTRKLLADTLTPVNIYLKLRDVYACSLLLESSDYHGHENSLSIICCDPIATFKVEGAKVTMGFPNGTQQVHENMPGEDIMGTFKGFKALFKVSNPAPKIPNGLFGFMAYDTVRYFDSVEVQSSGDMPDMEFHVYRYLVVVDHFTNELTLVEHVMEGLAADRISGGLDGLEQLIYASRFSTFPFYLEGPESSNMTDSDYLAMVQKGIAHCQRGDVFQIVLSRRFQQAFKGDEFNVYRALRSVNPSPYLFYFDFGNFKIFGSSPEAQIQIKNDTASIFPIAGTFKRTGNDAEDAELARKLAQDEKENAEHLMLVDLARNDLSRAASHVKVEVFKEIQFYSHVIHLVSKVSGVLESSESAHNLLADTFPAGTLSGAPKHKAMTLIGQMEPTPRGFYGGAIGHIGFEGDVNMAIMIRTFLSKNNVLTSQAGAGVVAKSIPENELAEVNNKLGALRKAVALGRDLVRY